MPLMLRSTMDFFWAVAKPVVPLGPKFALFVTIGLGSQYIVSHSA
jgi:hypothetical protein